MALASIASGTTTTDGTEQTLATDTTGKVYVLCADLSAMANGDEMELRLKTKILTGGTSREVYYAAFRNAQAQPQVYSPPVPADIEIVATLKKVAGTNRAIPWKLLSL